MRLLAFARVDLGLTEKQFFELTPAKFAALVDAKNQQLAREDYRAGVLCSVVSRIAGGKAEPFDFFPQHKPAQKSKGRATAKRRAAEWQAYLEAKKGK